MGISLSDISDSGDAVRIACGVVEAVADWLFWNTDESGDDGHNHNDIHWTVEALKLVSPEVRETYQGVERQ